MDYKHYLILLEHFSSSYRCGTCNCQKEICFSYGLLELLHEGLQLELKWLSWWSWMRSWWSCVQFDLVELVLLLRFRISIIGNLGKPLRLKRGQAISIERMARKSVGARFQHSLLSRFFYPLLVFWALSIYIYI